MLIQTGSAIPDRQLCLTFDDGPGPHTNEISAYLCAQGITAAFFLIGEFVAANRRVVRQLLDDGHEIGNHTHTHPVLTQQAHVAGPEIIAAHEQLRPFVAGREMPLFFRPPYGCWPTLPGLNELTTANGERLGDLYGGPISWDFSGDDWWYWQQARGADDRDAFRQAVERYSAAQRGIVLMHDHSREADIAARNQTYRMIKELVPIWKAKGCSFISLREAYRRDFLNVGM